MGSSTKSLIKDVVIIVVAIAVIWLGLQAVFGTANPFYVVSSGSMIPALEVYDVIVVEGNTPFEDIEKGDIIVFYSPKLYEQGKERVIVHRVSLDMSTDAQKIVRTKGDSNPASIAGTDYPITEKEYLGKVEYVVPQVGYITQILQPPINYIIIAVIIGVMIVKHFAGKEKKKIEFQYRNDESVDDDSNNVFEEKKESEYAKSSDKDESVDDDSNNVFEEKKESEYAKSSDKDESVDDDKKEL
ncbi:signal peptidase I [Candidatus Nitrosopelagicus sp.]|nr:signal peptidase I [Candidatus Nitrosopelagicus sp.]